MSKQRVDEQTVIRKLSEFATLRGWPRHVSDDPEKVRALCSVFYKAVSRLGRQQFCDAADECLATCRHFPMPADIMDHVADTLPAADRLPDEQFELLRDDRPATPEEVEAILAEAKLRLGAGA